MVGEDGKLLPNPRVVSNSMKLMEQRRPTTDTNILWVFFGQFIDHDLVSTVEIKGNFFISPLTSLQRAHAQIRVRKILINLL